MLYRKSWNGLFIIIIMEAITKDNHILGIFFMNGSVGIELNNDQRLTLFEDNDYHVLQNVNVHKI